MRSNQDTFVAPVFPLIHGRCLGCGRDNEYSPHRLAEYRKKCFKPTSLCTICLFTKRAAALKQPDVKVTATRVKDAETMTLRYITANFIIRCFMKRAAALEQPNVGGHGHDS